MPTSVHHSRFAFALLSWLALLAPFAASTAFATCAVQPFFLPLHLRVGADTSNCQYNDIQSAIDAVGECRTVIDITREHTYTDQHLSIDNKPNLTLQGWGDGVGCAQVRGTLDFPPYAPPDDVTPLVSLDGGGSGGRVLTITGNSNVTLRNLTVLHGATDASASGGGIDFDGSGSLTLTRSTVSFNDAGFGAGINMNGSTGAAALTLASDTLVVFNTASTSGGGIRVQGNARLYALQPKTLIGYNHAPNGYGGGLEVLGPARADIGSPGYNGIGVIYDNDAAYGGGMDILTFDNDADAVVRVFTTDAANPVQVSGNFASHTGGAAYLRPFRNFAGATADSILCLYDFRVEDNAAPEGAAIYSDADYSADDLAIGGGIDVNLPAATGAYDCVHPEAPPALGAVACAPGEPCNRFAGNKAEDQSGAATAGSTILLQTQSSLSGDRFSALGNTGAHLLREVGDGVTDVNTFAQLSNCLLADNVLTQELVAQTDGTDAYLALDSCTIAGNQIGAPYAFLAPGAFYLYGSIIDQPGRATVDPAKTDAGAVAHVLSNDRSTLPDSAYIDEGEPTFVDAANGNYRLVLTSLGIDSAPTQTGPVVTTLDLDRHPRVFDQPSIPDNFGPKDLGAYELQPACAQSDTLFCDGFETE